MGPYGISNEMLPTEPIALLLKQDKVSRALEIYKQKFDNAETEKYPAAGIKVEGTGQGVHTDTTAASKPV